MSVPQASVTQRLPSVLMARQPIFDRKLEVFAYELLFRNENCDEALFSDGTQATCQVLMNAYTGFHPENQSKQVPAFINLTRNLLLSKEMPPISKERVVIEVLEDVHIDNKLIAQIRNLSELGYRIALDDFILSDEYLPLLEIVDFIKIDIRQLSKNQLKEHVEKLNQYPQLHLLAEKVESQKEFEFCRKLGFDYFQGYFLDKPEIVKGRELGSNTQVLMQLLQKLQSPNTSIEEISDIISFDPALSYKLLRIINSATYALPREIKSIAEAITFLGLLKIRSWATIISLVNSDTRPAEILNKTLVRAGTCERYAEYTRRVNVQSYFIAGLFSGLDILLGMDLNECLEQLPLSSEIKRAILKYEGEIGEILGIVKAVEIGNWNYFENKFIDIEQLNRAYTESITWAKASLSLIDQ